jgi:hypothetical protein
LTASAAIQAGDLVVVSVGNLPNTTVSSISDGTNTYVKAVGLLSGGYNSEIWYAKNCSAVASPTITVTFASNANYRGICALRINAMNTSSPLDATNSTSGTGTTPSTTTGTLAQASEVVIGAMIANVAPTVTVSSGFTRGSINQPASGVTHEIEYQVVNSTGSVTFAPTLSSSQQYTATVASFKAG